MKRPNVLLLYTDQQRNDALRCSGNEHIHTPNLDALASSGALMTSAFCNNPVCMPSRQSMLSGQYPSVVGTRVNGVEMPEDVLTVHKVLKPYGFTTANIGKLHFKNHSQRDHRGPHPDYGFDELILSDEPGCYDDAYIKWVQMRDPSQVEYCRVQTPPAARNIAYRHHNRDVHEERPERNAVIPYAFEAPEHMTHTAFVAEETVSCIKRHKDGTFFAIAGFYAPHSPFNPPKRFVDMYDIRALPLPAMNEGENRQGLSDDEWRKVKAYYYALVTHIDDQVGRIMQALDEMGLRENTIVVFTSDHGEHLGDHGLTGKGAPGYDSCAHVPLIISYPAKIEAGIVKDEIIEAVDIVPTILDYCGVQIPPVMQGRSFRPLLEGGEYEERSSAYIEALFPFVRSHKTVRTRDFKYCTDNKGVELLFDLKEDPNELQNVAGENGYQDALNNMRHELIRRWFDVENQYPLRSGQY